MTLSISMLLLLFVLMLIGLALKEWGPVKLNEFGRALMWCACLVMLFELAKHHL